jgi:hypothetical protein
MTITLNLSLVYLVASIVLLIPILVYFVRHCVINFVKFLGKEKGVRKVAIYSGLCFASLQCFSRYLGPAVYGHGPDQCNAAAWINILSLSGFGIVVLILVLIATSDFFD